MSVSAEVDLRALDLFERLLSYPGNARFRQRLLKHETPEVLARLAELEEGHRARSGMPTDFANWASGTFTEPPECIGPFRLAARIGQGGMGDVWRGERNDGLFDQVVAIKLIKAQLAGPAAEAFDAERRILAKLDHPGIVRLIDGGMTEEGRPYLIMDFVEGAPFDDALQPLALSLRIQLFIQACQTVQFAHGKLVAHADLKPSNIIVDTQGRVRLLDFGIAELLSGEGGVGAPKGAMTVAFASPQRLAGAAPSIADDIFAMGVLLGTLLGDPKDQDLEAIVAMATAAEEVDRYTTVAALIADLENWRRGLPVSARPTTLPYVAGKFVSRHKRPVIAASLAVLALIGATLFATIASIRAERASAEASARFDDARGTARYLLFTLLDRLEAKPNTLALRAEAAGVAQHYLDRLANSSGATPAVRVETAKGYIRLAESQGVPQHQNLDQGALAQHNLEHGIELIGTPDTDELAKTLILALIEDMRLDSYVNNDPDAALKLLQRADAIALAHPGLSNLIRGRLQVEHADATDWKSQYGESKAFAERALQILGDDRSIDGAAARANAWELIGQADFGLGHLKPSIEDYRREVAIFEEVLRRYPSSRLVKLRLARARWQDGASDLDHPTQAALGKLTLASKEMHALAEFDADDEQTRRLGSYIDADRARLLALLGHRDQGLELIRSNLALEVLQAAQHPLETQWRRDHIIDLRLYAGMLLDGGQRAAGCDAFKEFDSQLAEIARRGNIANMSLDETIKDGVNYKKKYCLKASS